jgi:uncharacterized protein with HEPN domain
MERELAPILHDILQSIERIEIVTSGMTLETFSADWRASYIVHSQSRSSPKPRAGFPRR